MSTLSLVSSCLIIILQCLLFRSQFACAKTFSYCDFTESSIILLKDSSIHSNRVLTLTNQTQRSMSRVLYPNPIKIKANNNSVLSFSTSFVFAIAAPSEGMHGNGIAFIMAPNKSIVGATDSQYLGLSTPTTNGLESNHFLAVEFDTVYDPDLGDIDDNHVGVNKNGVKSFASQPAAYWTDKGHFNNLSLKSGENIQSWIDYDHVEDRLSVTVAVVGMEKPVQPLISVKKSNLSGVLNEEVYVGFTASTGIYAIESHYILGWSFSTEGKAPPLEMSDLPSFIKKKQITKSRFTVGVSVASVVLFLVAVLFGLIKVKEMKEREKIEEWELEFWPHRIPYIELKAATQNFSNDQLVGCGGFGRVYKGVLSRSGVEVAVKCIIKDSTAGMKEFISEISSVGRLQHRNLVQLRGWCRKNKELFIVYDYMPNGSLDKFIFPDPMAKLTEVISWERRYAILKGVAAGLLYLHEQWERRVVHRDVKSSNVLLDSELNAKLGDFGLARLYDHTQNPQTTRVVGTVGYIAPEVTNTGKVTPSSDVFSFGVVLLEVACGRRPVDLSKENEQIVLVDWVKDLYQNGEILHAADPNLHGVYDAEEMELVLKLGLVCSHPQAERRLGIRTVLQILEFQAPFPAHQILWISYDTSYTDYGSGVVHITDEEVTADQLASVALSVESATTSTSHGYEKRY